MNEDEIAAVDEVEIGEVEDDTSIAVFDTGQRGRQLRLRPEIEFTVKHENSFTADQVYLDGKEPRTILLYAHTHPPG